MLKTENNPDGLTIDVFDGLRAGSLADRSQLYKDLASGPFFGFNRPGAKVSQGMIDWFWFQGMQAGHKNAFDSIKAFLKRFHEDLKKFDVPTLIIHGDDDQIVPIGAAAIAACQTGEAFYSENLSRRAPRFNRHAQGTTQQRPSIVPQGLIPDVAVRHLSQRHEPRCKPW
jgi:pimeloyl-ACP methyl ester carboxylesterase